MIYTKDNIIGLVWYYMPNNKYIIIEVTDTHVISKELTSKQINKETIQRQLGLMNDFTWKVYCQAIEDNINKELEIEIW